MISVISSYKCEPGRHHIRDELAEVCAELSSRGFLSVDVFVDESDIALAMQEIKQELELDRIHHSPEMLLQTAKSLAKNVVSAISVGRGMPLEVPALATNFANISVPQSTSGTDRLWQKAVNGLAISLLMAHEIDTEIVEIVCGRRVFFDSSTGIVSHPPNKISEFEERFVEGVWKAYSRSYEALGSIPNAAIALEMEPDYLSLAQTPSELLGLRERLTKGINEWKDRILEPDRVLRLFGLNLDWGHLLLVLEREHLDSSRLVGTLEDMAPYVIHAHVSDHAHGAHWVDAPIGRFHSLDDFELLLEFQSDLIRKREGQSRDEWEVEYFSFSVAIELEACFDVSLVVETRDKLDFLSAKCSERHKKSIALTTASDEIARIQQTIASVDPNISQRGWFEGINGALYSSAKKLFRHSQDIPDIHDNLLNRRLLEKIRTFLTTRKYDIRVQKAHEISHETLKTVGLGLLSNWVVFLANQEWRQAFHSGYRDHTVHAVYVYLLGWMFYTELPNFRKFVQKDDSSIQPASATDDFFSNWAVAALLHDIGYPLESDKTDVRVELLRKVNDYHQQFVSWGILADSEADPFSENFRWYKRQCEAIRDTVFPSDVKQLCNVPENSVQEEYTDENDPRRFGAEKVLLSQIELARDSGLFDQLGTDELSKVGLEDNGLRKVHDFLRKVPPRGELVPDGQKRLPFLDHGIMSAALISCLKKTADEWYKAFEQKEIEPIPKEGVTEQTVSKIKEWSKSYKASASMKDLPRDALLAIACHNIYPEPPNSPKGNLHHPSDVMEGEGIVLQNFRIGKEAPIAFLLSLCDSLQEWHRNRFAHPGKNEVESYEPLDISAFPHSDGQRISINFSGKGDMNIKKEEEFNARFPDIWTRFLDLS